MLEGNQIYSLTSIIAGVFALLLGIYVFRKNPFMKTTSTFFILSVWIFWISILDFFLMNAPTESSARWIARFLFFMLIMMFGGFLYLSSLLPYEGSTRWFEKHRMIFWVGVTISAIIPSIAVDKMLKTSYGWGVPPSPAIFLLSTIILAYVSFSVYMLLHIAKRNKKIKNQCFIMMAGISAPFIYGLLTSRFMEYIGLNLPPLFSPGFLISITIFAYGVLRHRLFYLLPIKETDVRLSHNSLINSIKTDVDRILLVEEKRGEVGYTIFANEIGKGSSGLLITRTHPDYIREKFGLLKTPMIWLASHPGPDRIHPSNLAILEHAIIEFIQKADGPVIALEGLEFLITNNSTQEVMKLFYNIKDEIISSGGKLILTLDPATMSDNELALLERECSVFPVNQEMQVV